MKFFITLFFTLCFPLFIFLTTILSATDITPLLKADLVKNQIYTMLSNKVDTFDSGTGGSVIINEFIKNKFSAAYIQQKTETVIDSSDEWITGKSNTPPVLSFKDVKDELNAQYPLLLPDIEQTAQKIKQQETQNPQIAQQNPKATQNLMMIANFANSDFTIPLTTYLVGLKDFYAIIHILQPILAVLLLVSLLFLGVMNQTWHVKLKSIGLALLFGGIFGLALAIGNVAIINLFSKFTTHNANHIVQLASPILLQVFTLYGDTYERYQKIASISVLFLAVGCFIGMAFIRNSRPIPIKTKISRKKAK